MKTSRLARKKRKLTQIAAGSEQRAAKRSKYGAKKFEQEHGRKPDPLALSKARTR